MTDDDKLPNRIQGGPVEVKLNENAVEIPGESALLSRLLRKSGGSVGRVKSLIAVRNMAGVIRLRIRTHSIKEEDAVHPLLEATGLYDELLIDFEEVDEDGSVEGGVDRIKHPEYDAIYRYGKPGVERRFAPAREDPGPDPSWIEFFDKAAK
jgi:hypothetical protein